MSKNRISSIALFALAVFYVISGWNLKIWGHDVPGPGFVPLLLAICLVTLSIMIWFENGKPSEEHQEPGASLSKREPTIIALLVLVYTFVMPYLGFPLASLLLMVALRRLIEPASWIFDLTITITVTTVIYVVFVRILALQVPVLPVWMER